MKTTNVGIIGCGNISSIYLQNSKRFMGINIIACADLDVTSAKIKAEENQIIGMTVEEILQNPDIDLIINLTTPKAHAAVTMQALKAGKHVYSEKPLAINLEEAVEIEKLARTKGLRIGCAPDTFLGGGIQTCLKVINDGWIGRPVAATAFLMAEGPESWHPNPEFLYDHGAGPMFDMGPYYLTALVTLLGPIRRLTGSAQISFEERMITSEKRYGDIIQVKTPTHISGVLDFHSGVVANLITSFDIKGGSSLPSIEIYGSEGTLSVPDPNTFAGSVRFRKYKDQEWTELPLLFGHTENSRGLGVAEMVHSIRMKQNHRASGQLAYHVLEAMHGFYISSTEGQHYHMNSTCDQPASMSNESAFY